MSEFLSREWFESLNVTLGAAGPAPMVHGTSNYRVVLDFLDGPPDQPPALTFTLTTHDATVVEGSHPAPDTRVRLAYADALALTTGAFDSASALREGRIKVRGDINALVPLLVWLQRAHPRAASSDS